MLTISDNQNNIVDNSSGKTYLFKLAKSEKANGCDCEHCSFVNTEFCGDAPCNYRKDKKEGYFTELIK